MSCLTPSSPCFRPNRSRNGATGRQLTRLNRRLHSELDYCTSAVTGAARYVEQDSGRFTMLST